MGEAGDLAVDPQCIALLKESISQLEEPMQEESNYIFTVLGASVSLSRLKFVILVYEIFIDNVNSYLLFNLILLNWLSFL